MNEESRAAPAAPERKRFDPDDPLQALTALTPDGPPPEIPLERLDPEALKVVHRLRAHGHQAYLVGGCVRDLLLGGKPKDFDVATSAHPGDIRAVFRNCRLIGRRFRLAHVYFRGGKVVETATFRANPNEELSAEEAAAQGDLLITRDNVFGTAEEDARRRDFTINGLFYDVVLCRVIDYVGGREDLELRRIRTIGDPDVRFREDPVRILRAVRFAAKCGLDIEAGTWRAMKSHAPDIARCAPPRVLEEIFRLLRSGHARRCFELLRDCGAMPVLLPPVAEFLDRAPPEEANALFEGLGLLDGVVRAGPLPDDAVLLAALLVHLSQAELMKQRAQKPAAADDAAAAATGEEAEGDVEDEPSFAEGAPLPEPVAAEDAAKVPWSASASARSVDALLGELVRSARLPRRIAERARLLLYAQRIVSGLRRRRGSPAHFARQPYFEDALLVFELYAKATGHGLDALERWRARLEQVKGEARPAPAAEAEAGAPGEGAEAEEGGRRRRRRRRGGRRDDEGAGDGPEASAAPVADEPARAAPEPRDRERDGESRRWRGPANLFPF